MPDLLPLPGSRFQLQTWSGEYRLGPACFRQKPPLSRVALELGWRAQGLLGQTPTVVLPSSLSQMILYFYFGGGAFFLIVFKSGKNHERLCVSEGYNRDTEAAVSWHPPLPQTTLLPKLCPSVDYVTSDTSVLKFQCAHICPHTSLFCI